MQIAAITDLHGRMITDVKRIEKLQKCDQLIVVGDITHFGDRKAAEKVLNVLQTINKNILSVHGNCDHDSVNYLLTSMGINIHNETRTIDDVNIYGVGGCSRSPFNTPQEYTEEELSDFLKNFKTNSDQWNILVSHSPPYNTKVDRTFMGLHVGSKAVRKFIEIRKPDVVLCGHIHEARGVDKVNETIVINPGPFPDHIAFITIGENISYELL